MFANCLISLFFGAIALFGFWVVRESTKLQYKSPDVVFGMVIGAMIMSICGTMAIAVLFMR